MTDSMTIMRTYKVRLRPKPEQDARMRSWSGAVRAAYNAALQQREWYGRAAGTDFHGRDCRFSAVRQGRELKALRAEFEWMADCPSDALGIALRDLDKAFDKFFKDGAGYPSPRRRDENESFSVPVFKAHESGMFRSADGKPLRANVVFGKDCIKLPKLGWVPWIKHAKIKGRAKTATVVREGDRWFVCISSELQVSALQPAGDAVGIDIGVAVPLMTSEGEALPYRRTPEKLTKRQKRLQREVSRSRKGSRRRKVRIARLARMARHIAARRKGQMHAITTDIARRYGVVAVEDLRVRNMTRSAKGTAEQPGRNVAAKAGLNRSMLDVSPHLFRLLLTYKVSARGGVVVAVDPKNTSRTCPVCGHVDAESRRSQAEFRCVKCGHEDNADANAALNILRRGLAQITEQAGRKAGTSAAVAGRRKAPSESRRGSATPKPIVSPSRAGQHRISEVFASEGTADTSTPCGDIGCGDLRNAV